MNSKFFIYSCATLAVLLCAANADLLDDLEEEMEETDHGFIHWNHEAHPNQICQKAMNNPKAIWGRMLFRHKCDTNIICRVLASGENMILDEKPQDGVECRKAFFFSASRKFACKEGECQRV